MLVIKETTPEAIYDSSTQTPEGTHYKQSISVSEERNRNIGNNLPWCDAVFRFWKKNLNFFTVTKLS